ncbi:MAG: DUF3592 domain-containing protein [Ferruginibacter sp.]
MICMLYPTIVKDCYYAVTFKRTIGEVITLKTEKIPGVRARHYPVIRFNLNNSSYDFEGSSFLYAGSQMGDSVPVIFDPGDPSKAFVYTYLGFWAPELVYLLPFSLTLTLMVFLDSIPQYFTIRF